MTRATRRPHRAAVATTVPAPVTAPSRRAPPPPGMRQWQANALALTRSGRVLHVRGRVESSGRSGLLHRRDLDRLSLALSRPLAPVVLKPQSIGPDQVRRV